MTIADLIAMQTAEKALNEIRALPLGQIPAETRKNCIIAALQLATQQARAARLETESLK